jgi:pimeloyl-ACP methyl ester carboxylesterase
MKLIQKIAVGYLRIKFKILSAISKKRAAEQAFKLFCTPQSHDKNDLPEIFQQAEKLNFKFDQYDIIGYRWNKGGQRKALIIHGFESSAINFGKYINPLIKKGYEVLAFDAPAHGRSSGKQITAIVYSDFIKYIQRTYGPVQSYLAHSFGGLVLSLILAEMPNNDEYSVALIAPATETITAIDQFFQFLQLDANVKNEFENLIIKLSGHPVSWFSINRAMKNIQAKILWLHDEDDKTTPLSDALKVKAENYPNVQFVITKGLGHSGIYRDGEVGRTIVDFL